MRAIRSIAPSEAASLDGVLFDIDDTLLDEGHLTTLAYEALHALQAAGLRLIAVTGRPSEWGRILCKQWPVDAVVTENGAIAWRLIGARPTCLDALSPEERGARRARLLGCVARLRQSHPELVPSDDVAGRLSDYSFDIGEFRQVAADVVRRVMADAADLGLTVTRSSVHLHVTLDRWDKATGALRFLARELSADPTAARFRYAYVGDSENDAPCFAAFRTTVGVANLRGRFSVPPRFRTTAPRGAGFAELATVLIEARGRARGGASSRP